MFDSKSSSTSIHSEGKSNDVNDDAIDNDDDELLFLKRLMCNKENDCDFFSDEYESEKDDENVQL